jgi:hypothetical protein
MDHILNASGLVIGAAFTLDDDSLKIVAGSVLASAVVVLVFVLREKRTGLRLVFGLIALALVGWAFFLWQETEIEKTKQAPQVAACKGTLREVRAIARTKLEAVETKDEAQAVAQQLINTVEGSDCKP